MDKETTERMNEDEAAFLQEKAELYKRKTALKKEQTQEAENGKKEEKKKRSGNRMEFTLQLSAKELWQFSLYHANGGMLGIFNLLFTVAAFYLLVTKWTAVTIPYRILLIVCVLLFTVWLPLLLYNKARKQAKSPAVKNPMTLSFGEDGLVVSQNGQEAEFSWDQMARMDKAHGITVLYMDRVHAYLIPKKVLGDREEAFYEMVRRHLPKERRKRI